MFEVLGDCMSVSNNHVIEGYSLEEQKHRVVAAYDSPKAISDMRNVLDMSTSWLEPVSEKYKISSNIKDYIFVPVVIFSTNLPNRNGVGFPVEPLLEFNPETGCLGYESWKRKCLHVEHDNKDITKSKGTIFDSRIFPMRNAKGNLFKVVLLTGWDRSKDPVLANQILSGERTNYSMGSWSSDFTCSVCGSAFSKNQNGCGHLFVLGKEPPKMQEVNGQLAFWKVTSVLGFECSSVRVGAYSLFSETPTDRIFQY